MRPVCRAIDVAMPDRVEVDGVDVVAQVVRVADQVFPVAALPDATLALRQADYSISEPDPVLVPFLSGSPATWCV